MVIDGVSRLVGVNEAIMSHQKGTIEREMQTNEQPEILVQDQRARVPNMYIRRCTFR